MKVKEELTGILNTSKTIKKKKTVKTTRNAKVGSLINDRDVSAGKTLVKTLDKPDAANGNPKLKKTKKNKTKDNVKTEIKSIDNQQKIPEKDEAQLGERDLVKIEKKKSKKLAQKLKKQQGRAEATQTEAKKGTTTTVQPVSTPELKNVDKVNKKKQKDVKNNASKQNKKGSNQQTEKEPRSPRSPALEAATVFVGNLPTNTKRVQLATLFKPYGIINGVRFRTAAGKPIFKHKQRKEAGTLIAYVVLQTEEQAKKALTLNGTEFKNNHLRVTAANVKSRDAADNKRTIFVGNLKFTANEEKLRDIFSSCGEIEYVRCLQESGKGCKGVAYVSFKAPEAVGLALELNETMLDERPIHVERYSVKKLGAKEARDAAVGNELKKPKAGSQKRVADKKQLKKKGGKVSKNSTDKDAAIVSDNKKNEFRGVKVKGVDKNKQKKKKTNSEMKKLAKKIAPKNKATK